MSTSSQNPTNEKTSGFQKGTELSKSTSVPKKSASSKSVTGRKRTSQTDDTYITKKHTSEKPIVPFYIWGIPSNGIKGTCIVMARSKENAKELALQQTPIKDPVSEKLIEPVQLPTWKRDARVVDLGAPYSAPKTPDLDPAMDENVCYIYIIRGYPKINPVIESVAYAVAPSKEDALQQLTQELLKLRGEDPNLLSNSEDWTVEGPILTSTEEVFWLTPPE